MLIGKSLFVEKSIARIIEIVALLLPICDSSEKYVRYWCPYTEFARDNPSLNLLLCDYYQHILFSSNSLALNDIDHPT